MDVRYNEGDWLNKIQATQLLGSDGANEEGLSVVGLLKKAAREVEKAEDDIARYDKDYAIRLDVRQYPSQYDGWGEKMYWLQQAVTKIPDELSSSVDYPFLQSMDQFVEKLSHFDIASETTPAKVAIPNPNYSADGMDRNGSLQQVSLTDLMYRKSPLTKYMKAEYFALQQESGIGCTYEEYEALAFASTAFEYTSFNEKKTDFVVNTVVNGGILALGAALPWTIAMGLGLVSGGVNSYEALSGKAIGGRELSGKERILRGVFGALDLALVGYSGVKGFKNRGSKVPEIEALNENELTRQRVLKNIEESKKARESSNFKEFSKKSNSIVDDVAKNASGAKVPSISNKKLNDLPDNVKNSFEKYDKNGWGGNVEGQTPGTKAGGTYKNRDGKLPSVDENGNKITYGEFDVNNKLSNSRRDSERFVRGSDGSLYYTDNHYDSFIKIE